MVVDSRRQEARRCTTAPLLPRVQQCRAAFRASKRVAWAAPAAPSESAHLQEYYSEVEQGTSKINTRFSGVGQGVQRESSARKHQKRTVFTGTALKIELSNRRAAHPAEKKRDALLGSSVEKPSVGLWCVITVCRAQRDRVQTQKTHLHCACSSKVEPPHTPKDTSEHELRSPRSVVVVP